LALCSGCEVLQRARTLEPVFRDGTNRSDLALNYKYRRAEARGRREFTDETPF